MLRRILTLALAGCAQAWLPGPPESGDPNVRSRNYTDPRAGDNSTLQWLPYEPKIRGVNLGSMFIIEPWMAFDEWRAMGCSPGHQAEWDCVAALGQDRANAAWRQHWETWITPDDVGEMRSYGLNTVRIPVGYWIKEDLVWPGEWFPRGGLPYLDRLVGWLSDAGFYVIIDLHGGPGAQTPDQSFTGHKVSEAGFFTDANYERANNWLEWMSNKIHTDGRYRNVGMLQVMNEPVQEWRNGGQTNDMRRRFYPSSYNRIRDAERRLGTTPNNYVHVQYMANAWGSGNPSEFLPGDRTMVMFDDHRYYKWDPWIEKSQAGYMRAACGDDRGGPGDLIIGEWSLQVADELEQRDDFEVRSGRNNDFYRRFWAAQVRAFERSRGWVFWTWKCNWINGFDDWRWCYQSAVRAGVIPKDAGSAGSISGC